MQKVLMIGVGGSGGNTLRYTCRELERRLAATGWDRGVPKAWQFLHIDVRSDANDLLGDVPFTLQSDTNSHLGLATYPLEYDDYDKEIVDHDGLLSAIAGWRPDPSKPYNSPWEGAGQRRAVGRVITITRLNLVAKQLGEALATMNASGPDKELQELADHLNVPDLSDGGGPPARAIVVSSLGGGAGSGAFLDVIQLLKARATQDAQWLQDPMSVLFAADIFASLDPTRRKGVEANTLAAWSELLAAYEHQGPMDSAEGLVAQLGGGSVPLSGSLAPRYNFFIGRGTLPDSAEVYRATGKALSALIVSPQIQSQFDGYLKANWSGTSVRLQFGMDTDINSSSSFGYGNVTLGRSLFARYAAERLASAALNRLLAGHREGLEPGAFARDQTLIEERAASRETTYFAASGLWELGKENNQVLDALRDATAKKAALDGVVARVLTKVAKGSAKTRLSPADWAKSLKSTFDDEATKYIVHEDTERREKALAWVAHVQQAVVDATVEQVAGEGIPVALNLIDRLSTQVQEAARELHRADAMFRGDKKEGEPSFLENAIAVFDTIKDRVIGSNHGVFQQAATFRRTALSRRTEADLYKTTADLLDDLHDRLLPGLRRAVASLQANLESDLARAEIKEQVGQWSIGPVGVHLLPAPNETLLEAPDTFPTKLDALLKLEFDTDGAGNALSQAVAQVISGDYPTRRPREAGDDSGQLLKVADSWRPNASDLRSAADPASVAMLRSDLTPAGLLERASLWVTDQQGDFSKHVDETLSSWLNPDHAEANKRATAFSIAIDQALKHAAPLVSVNPDALKAAHDMTSIGQELVMGPIPLAKGHKARALVEKSLATYGVPADKVAKMFDPNFSGGEIEAMSFLGASVHPIVFDSLTGPISQDWGAKRTKKELRNDFWTYRRARPLTSFIPISTSHQSAMVRGWLTAGTLGYVDVLTGAWSDAPRRVWTPDGPRAFPQYLFSDVRDNVLVLPALLEALPLAMVSFGTGTTHELEAYERLIELGRDGDGAVDRYESPNSELANWVALGEATKANAKCPAAPVPRAEAAGTKAMSPDARRDHIIEKLAAAQDFYESQIHGLEVTPRTAGALDPRWEIRHLYVGAVGDLISGLQAVRTVSGPEF
jgi:hypothetical protein